jgi:hypothetical protein
VTCEIQPAENGVSSIESSQKGATVKKTKIVQPMIDEVSELQQPNESEGIPPDEPKPAELDQDAGGGFNPDHTYPQP